MEWYVYYYNCNGKRIEKYNVFEHGSFKKEFDLLLELGLSKEEFSDKLKRILMYYFWSKCEWETVLKPWVGDDSVEEKIDVFDQVMLNWDKFVDYCWSFTPKYMAEQSENLAAIMFAKHYEEEQKYLV